MLLLALVIPANSLAQDAKAPPGLSAADEYLETVPKADGNATVGNGQRPNPDDPAVGAATKAALPAAVINELSRAGDAGKSAAALAGRTAPANAAMERAPNAAMERAPLLERSGPGPLAAVGRIATGGGGDGMGILFPLLIVAGTLAVAGSALWRRRDTAV